MKKHRFTVIIEKDEDGLYVASVPALPGCHTQADNLNELESRIKEVIRLCLEANGTESIITETLIGVHQIEVAI